MEIDHNGRAAETSIEQLDRAECLALLAGDEVGRLAVIAGGGPEIFPVNYVLDGDSIVFRTAPGTKLEAVGRARACFEIDAFDRAHRTGWSVIAHGRLEEIDRYRGRLYDHIQALPVDPWASGPKEHWLRLVPQSLTGRRISPKTAVEH